MRLPMKYLLIPFFLVLVSCTNNPDVKDNDTKASESLVGVWRGEGSYDDEEDPGWKESWKMVRGSDGTYMVDYMIVHDGEKRYEQSSDAGTWSYKDGVYYEINSNEDKITYDVFIVKKDRFEYNLAERQGTANIEETKTVETFQLQDPPDGYSLVSYDQPLDQLLDDTVDESTQIISSVNEIEKADEAAEEFTEQLE